jgi:hypothetical protein
MYNDITWFARHWPIHCVQRNIFWAVHDTSKLDWKTPIQNHWQNYSFVYIFFCVYVFRQTRRQKVLNWIVASILEENLISSKMSLCVKYICVNINIILKHLDSSPNHPAIILWHFRCLQTLRNIMGLRRFSERVRSLDVRRGTRNSSGHLAFCAVKWLWLPGNQTETQGMRELNERIL